MYKVIKGDLLETNADIICHQVNLQGVMGGGLAYQIANKFPEVNNEYVKFTDKQLGNVCFANAGKFIVANCFSQTTDFCTNYNSLKECLIRVREYMSFNNFKTVAIPYKYGCGIANGDWQTVFDIFNDVFSDYELLIYQK